MMSETETETVKASPFKEFFISVITRDIRIVDTIPEFVDNSIDGANRIRDSDNLSGLYVAVDVNENEFSITDNCGGIKKDIAKNYAFRFGRDEEAESVIESIIGKFGVGMKRSLFKLGRSFLIESKTEDVHYVIEINVDEWLERAEWEFELEPISTDDRRATLTEPGTRIVVTELDDHVSDKFSQELFVTKIINNLRIKNRQYLRDGIELSVNGDLLEYSPLELKTSENLTPASETFTVDKDGTEVQIRIQVGVGERSPDRAGWYIFCNGRLVDEANKSGETGWGTENIPQYHNDYSRFRGMVDFRSNNPGVLPWNTSKTDINSDAQIFETARQKMRQHMMDVLDYLKDIRKQKEEAGSSVLEQQIERAESRDVAELSASEDQSFSIRSEEEQQREEMANIHYSREKELVEEVQEELGVSTYKAVGEKTFDYFYEFEMEGY